VCVCVCVCVCVSKANIRYRWIMQCVKRSDNRACG
jgi:hypothetical protein